MCLLLINIPYLLEILVSELGANIWNKIAFSGSMGKYQSQPKRKF